MTGIGCGSMWASDTVSQHLCCEFYAITSGTPVTTIWELIPSPRALQTCHVSNLDNTAKTAVTPVACYILKQTTFEPV